MSVPDTAPPPVTSSTVLAWNSTTIYSVGNIVYYPPTAPGTQWKCISGPNINQQPDAPSSIYWASYSGGGGGGNVVASVGGGNGITVTGGSGPSPVVATNIVASTGIQWNPTGLGTQYEIINTLPFEGLTAGSNITISGGTSNAGVITGGPLTLNATVPTLVSGVQAGSNFTITGGTSNAGVVSGGPLTLSATIPTLVSGVQAGTNITLAGGTSNAGVVSGGPITISAVAGAGPSAGPGISVVSNVVSMSANNNTTLTFPTAGSAPPGPYTYNPAYNNFTISASQFPRWVQVAADQNSPGGCSIQVLVQPGSYSGYQNYPAFTITNDDGNGPGAVPIVLYIYIQSPSTGIKNYINGVVPITLGSGAGGLQSDVIQMIFTSQYYFLMKNGVNLWYGSY